MNDMDVILILSFMTAWNILGMNDGKAHENVNEMAFFFLSSVRWEVLRLQKSVYVKNFVGQMLKL